MKSRLCNKRQDLKQAVNQLTEKQVKLNSGFGDLNPYAEILTYHSMWID